MERMSLTLQLRQQRTELLRWQLAEEGREQQGGSQEPVGVVALRDGEAQVLRRMELCDEEADAARAAAGQWEQRAEAAVAEARESPRRSKSLQLALKAILTAAKCLRNVCV